MSYVPMFGIGECTAQLYAFKILWLQHRRVNGITYENENFSRFYHYFSSVQSGVLLPTGELTMGMQDGYSKMIPDPRFTPVDFLNVRKNGESRYEWSERMMREYPWERYLDVVNPEDLQYIMDEISRQKKIKESTA